MINILVERSCLGFVWKQERRYTQGEGDPLDVQVGNNRLTVDLEVGGNLLGTARPKEPWVNIVLRKGSGGVRVTLVGDPSRDPIRTHYIVPSIPMDEVDSFSASYREIVIEERGFLGRIFGNRVTIQNTDAFPRISGVAPEELFEMRRELMSRRSHRAVDLLGLPPYFA